MKPSAMTTEYVVKCMKLTGPGPCLPALEFLSKFTYFKEAWTYCDNIAWMIWYLTWAMFRASPPVKTKIRARLKSLWRYVCGNRNSLHRGWAYTKAYWTQVVNEFVPGGNGATLHDCLARMADVKGVTTADLLKRAFPIPPLPHVDITISLMETTTKKKKR